MKNDDLREELMKVKKAHQLALRENAQCRTRLRIVERECRRRETEMEQLLAQQSGEGGGKGGGGRMEVAALRRKVLLYERMLHEKSAENEKLLADKSVAQAAETRKLVAKLEKECQQLRHHLAQSVPESELRQEKEQYMAIISRLVEENMHLRGVIGEFDQRRKETERIIAKLGGSDALIRQFRHTTISSKKQANFYRKALNNLLRNNRKGPIRGRRESMIATEGGRGGGQSGDKGRGRRMRRAQSEDERRRMMEDEEEKGMNEEKRKRREEEQRKRGGSGGQSEEEEEEEGGMKRSGGDEEEEEGSDEEGETEGQQKRQVMYPSEEEEDEEEQRSSRKMSPDERSAQSRCSSAPPASFPPSSSASSSSSRREELLGKEQEEEEMEEEEDEEDGVIEESHLTALCRILHGHLLREQMIKVRRERETSHLVGGNFF